MAVRDPEGNPEVVSASLVRAALNTVRLAVGVIIGRETSEKEDAE